MWIVDGRHFLMFDVMKTMMMIMMMMTKPKEKKTQKKGFASVINCSQINNTIQNLSRFFCTYIRVIQSCVRSQDKRPEFCIYCSPLFFCSFIVLYTLTYWFSFQFLYSEKYANTSKISVKCRHTPTYMNRNKNSTKDTDRQINLHDIRFYMYRTVCHISIHSLAS